MKSQCDEFITMAECTWTLFKGKGPCIDCHINCYISIHYFMLRWKIAPYIFMVIPSVWSWQWVRWQQMSIDKMKWTQYFCPTTKKNYVLKSYLARQKRSQCLKEKEIEQWSRNGTNVWYFVFQLIYKFLDDIMILFSNSWWYNNTMIENILSLSYIHILDSLSI